jgi:hypothetical protein
MISKFTLQLSALLLAGILVACGGSAEPQQTLEERVLARWQHLIDRDFESAWAYYTPGFRQTTPVEVFVGDMQRRRFRWHEAEIKGVECDGEAVCQVEVRVVFQAVGAPSGMGNVRLPHEATERWLLLEGEWWLSEQ